MKTVHHRKKYACDVCGQSPARKTSGQGQWQHIYLCEKHKKDNAGTIN